MVGKLGGVHLLPPQTDLFSICASTLDLKHIPPPAPSCPLKLSIMICKDTKMSAPSWRKLRDLEQLEEAGVSQAQLFTENLPIT